LSFLLALAGLSTLAALLSTLTGLRLLLAWLLLTGLVLIWIWLLVALLATLAALLILLVH
jgi:hypothetical protein